MLTGGTGTLTGTASSLPILPPSVEEPSFEEELERPEGQLTWDSHDIAREPRPGDVLEFEVPFWQPSPLAPAPHPCPFFWNLVNDMAGLPVPICCLGLESDLG